MSIAASPAQREISIQPIANLEAAERETKRVIFFAGDAIPSREKFEMPNVKGEGIYLPQFLTLPKNGEHQGSKGMVHRCQFTAMQVDMKPEWEVMLPPGERKHYPQAFISDDGVTKKTVSGWLGSSAKAVREGEFKHERHSDIRYHKVLPGDEVLRIVERSQPHGVGGVIEIKPLRGATAEEIESAQQFFFPNWNDIREGSSQLPVTIRELEAHIKGRIAEIPTYGFSPEMEDQYRQIGADMLQSCTTFRLSALEIIEKDDILKQDAAKNGVTAPHSPVSEHLLPQIEYKRKGDLLAGEASSTAELVREMREDRKAQSGASSQAFELEKLRLENEKLGLELQIAQARSSTDVVSVESQSLISTEDPEPDMPVRLCGAKTAKGECQRELKPGEDACFQHNGPLPEEDTTPF